MEDTGAGQNATPEGAQSENDRRFGFIDKIKSKLHERKTKKEQENPVDRAARITAKATAWIAVFTVVMALVGIGTLYEIIEGGGDTHDLAVAAGKQADRMKDLADRMKDQADRTKDLADRMKDQADQTKTIAGQAVIQANAARSAAGTARESLESVQRAFITYLSTKSDRTGRPEGTYFYDFVPVFQNSGVTPAKVVGSYFSAKWAGQQDELMDESLFEGENPSFASLTIGPKAEQQMGPHREEESSIFGVDFGSDLSRFHEGKMDKLLIIWAWIAYRDIFPGTKLHLTEFCDATYGARRSLVTGVAFYSRSCVHHNCTDEDCPDYGEITRYVNSRKGTPRRPVPKPN